MCKKRIKFRESIACLIQDFSNQ